MSLKAGSELRERIHFPWLSGPRAALLIQVSWCIIGIRGDCQLGASQGVGHGPHSSGSPVTAVPFTVAFPCLNHFSQMLGPGLPC